MVTSLWDIAAALLGTATVLAQTTSPLPQLPRNPIPGGSRLFTQTSNTITSTPFVNLPAATPQVTGEAEVEAFIYNNTNCAYAGSPLYYRLYVGNTGGAVARSLNIQFQYPTGTTFTSAEPAPDQQDPNRRLLEWSEDSLASKGGYAQYAVTVRADTAGEKQSILIVTYLQAPGQVKQTVTTHTLPGNCSEPNAPTKENPSKLPAIICDPAETSCVPFLPTLGIRFGQNTSKPFILNQPKPILGVRFNEAVADIVPGDCRVAADDIVTTPEYHDALNRLYDPAAFYMQPLYNSGLDFKQLVHENYLLGLKQMIAAREVLQPIHTKYWQRQADTLTQVLQKKVSTATVREQIQSWRDGWIQETRVAQQSLGTKYLNMQSARKAKFDPVAEKAVSQATVSIQRACNTNSDGGLRALLPAIKQAYVVSLDQQTQTYSQAQAVFADPNNAVFPTRNKADTWMSTLRSALDAFDQGNPRPLRNYVASIAYQDQQGFDVAFSLTYQAQLTNDQTSDEGVRLKSFEVALDKPKEQATSCEKDKVFKAPVDTTYCESASVPPEVLGPEASKERQKNSDARPAAPIAQDPNVSINTKAVEGVACSADPNERGAPWWAEDCSCQCNDQVPTLDSEGNVVFAACQDFNKMTRHDRAVNSQEECLLQKQQSAGEPYPYF